MNRIAEQIGSSLGLLRALESISNRRAFMSLLAGSLIGAVLFAATFAIAASLAMKGNAGLGSMTGFIGGVLAVLVMLSGFSAAGIHLILYFRNGDALSLTEGFMAALVTLPKFLGVAILIALIYLGFTVAIMLVYLACKIPGIGPLLYAVALPVSAVIMGILAYAAFFLSPLIGPAIWSGERVMTAIAKLWAILRDRLFAVVIKAILLVILTGLVGSLIMGAVVFGLINAGLLSATVIGVVGGDPMAMLGALTGGGGHGSGHMTAGAFGSVILLASASVLPLLVLIGGNCIIYIETADGLSTGEIEDQLMRAYKETKGKAIDAAERIKAAGESAREKYSHAGNNTAVTQSLGGKSAQCMKCLGPIGSDDTFCGNCGHKLK